MNHVNKQFVANQEVASGLSPPFAKALDRIRQAGPLNLIWWCLALSIVSATWARYTTEATGLSYHLMVTLGSGGCAWFWLLSRALFRHGKALQSKAVLLVPLIIVIEAIEALVFSSGVNEPVSEFSRVFGNMASMVCITAIVCVWHEALHGFSQIRSKQERHFRLIFLGAFGALVGVAILWVMGAQAETFAGEWNDALLTFCAFFGLAGSRLAVDHRLKFSRADAAHSAQASQGLLNEQDSMRLADKILQALNNDALLTKPNLKVADLADHIDEQEYKVTRCITSHLQYRNFNQMVNKHRIDRAIDNLKDPDNSQTNVATIAFDCGFNSLGPFNRAFRQHTGMTPREFRQSLQSD